MTIAIIGQLSLCITRDNGGGGGWMLVVFNDGVVELITILPR